MSYWSVAMTKAAREHTAAENLARQGYNTYLPKYLSRIQGKDPKIKILFPRYIFVLIEHQFHSINSTFGISRLIMIESKPAVVPTKIIEGLKLRENKKGLIALPPNPKFQLGDQVKIAEGPLAGYTMIYDGMSDADRASVLMDILGRKVSITVNEKDLVAV